MTTCSSGELRVHWPWTSRSQCFIEGSQDRNRSWDLNHKPWRMLLACFSQVLLTASFCLYPRATYQGMVAPTVNLHDSQDSNSTPWNTNTWCQNLAFKPQTDSWYPFSKMVPLQHLIHLELITIVLCFCFSWRAEYSQLPPSTGLHCRPHDITMIK